MTGTEKTPAVQGYETTNAPLSKVTIASGGYMINPLSKAMDVELVGCYGKGKSVNFGDVYLVLKVKMNLVEGDHLNRQYRRQRKVFGDRC